MGNCLENVTFCSNYNKESVRTKKVVINYLLNEVFLFFRPIPILILGLKNSGKTDIAFRLLNKKRDDYTSTKGCRVFSTKINKRLIKFTELGGEEFYDIWKYYFLDVSS